MNIIRGKTAKAQKVVLYGPEGIGKSTFASHFPDPLFIDTEGSTTNMDVARFDKPTSWAMLLQQIDYVKKNYPCKSLIIDTIDWAQRMTIEHICSASKKKSIEDFGYGSGFIKLEEELGRFLNQLQDLVDGGINVVLTAHAQIKKFDKPDEMGSYDRYELKLDKKTSARTSALVKEWADMVLFATYKTIILTTDAGKGKAQGGERVIYTTHHPAWDAKNRFGLPDEIPMKFTAIEHIFAETAKKANTSKQPEIYSGTTHSTLTSSSRTTDQILDDTSTIFDPQTVPPLSESISNQFPVPEKPTPDNYVSLIDYNNEQYHGVPPTLLDLMRIENVTAFEIEQVTHAAFPGVFPLSMELKDFPHEFIEQALIPQWSKALTRIKQDRKKTA